MDASTVAFIAASQVILLAILQAWVAARKEARDYARQDAVADRAERAAELLLQAQRDTISRTDEVARLAQEAGTLVSEQLKAIHTLVNSDMTAARTAERDAMTLLVISLKQQVAASIKVGINVPNELRDQILYAEERIQELNQILADRLAAQTKVDEEAAKKQP